ncbi:hypothetical protein AB1Y20_016481 [Prymnesium parvum]|uniref:Mitochondrial carrier protein n=1 Tax=Prymnesium parvum TaxID=97485 RepID=A0AB34IEW5_PRYPA|mmetsp:Transcript_4279/g.10629  ORF Transcript_4279/g.10629 Transcript_4279/m.10629 type:complete len:296 (+) Transcript_4279:61-948(+)
MSLIDTVSGMAGAVLCTAFGNPFDVAKARLQHQGPHGAYRGLTHCLAATVRADGFSGLYRGALPALSSALVENSVGITVQRSLRRQLAAAQGRESLCDVRYSTATEIALGGCTGIFTSVAICPFEVVKVRQQVHRDSRITEVLRLLIRKDGLSGLYRGLLSVICRDVPFNAIFYGFYESLCTLAMRLQGVGSKDALDAPVIFLAGGLAGSAGWTFIMPFDVVKTRQQAGSAHGMPSHVMYRIVQSEGWKALFKGWNAAVARAFPANAGLFLGVELSSRWMARWATPWVLEPKMED